MNKPYSATTVSDAWMGTSHDFATFPELLEFCNKNHVLQVCNSELCDYATDTGFEDGLTEDERDQLGM